MDLVVLGTGTGRGWPEPGCSCASCLTAERTGRRRAPSGVVVDGVLSLDGERDDLQSTSTAPRGEPLQVGEHVVRVLPSGNGSAFDVTDRDDTRLLYAPLGAPELPDGAAYDVVVVGGGFTRLPLVVAALRAAGAVAADSLVVPVQLGHDAPPAEELRRLLRAWGMHEVAEGDALTVPSPAVQQDDPPRRTLVLGGARSGKSALAERLLAAEPRVSYVATGGTGREDADWAARVALHRERRPSSWRTVETYDVAGCLRDASAPLLVDCLGTWLAGLLDRHGIWEGAPADRLHTDLDDLLAAWRSTSQRVVAVSNEVGSGVVPATSSGRLFRDLLGRLNARIAAESECVLLTVAGVPVPLREPGP